MRLNISVSSTTDTISELHKHIKNVGSKMCATPLMTEISRGGWRKVSLTNKDWGPKTKSQSKKFDTINIFNSNFHFFNHAPLYRAVLTFFKWAVSLCFPSNWQNCRWHLSPEAGSCFSQQKDKDVHSWGPLDTKVSLESLQINFGQQKNEAHARENAQIINVKQKCSMLFLTLSPKYFPWRRAEVSPEGDLSSWK